MGRGAADTATQATAAVCARAAAMVVDVTVLRSQPKVDFLMLLALVFVGGTTGVHARGDAPSG